MKVLVSGSTGLVGTALVNALRQAGDEVVRLVRNRSESGEDVVYWEPLGGTLDPAALEGVDAVVHLAGENVGVGRWTASKKEKIRNSRVKGTNTLVEALKRMNRPPKTFISASAVGYYGERGDTVLREDASLGEGFLADVCREWEAASAPLSSVGTRVNHARIGVVLSTDGGALKEMLLPFKMGAGGVLGNGKQFFSWIALDDLVRAIQHLLHAVDQPGPFNMVAPNPVTNYEFTKTLGKVLSRPTVLPMPRFAAKLAFGADKAEELLLASVRAEPARLLDTGFEFQFPQLEPALRHALGK